ncbi:MAG: hypothetical protein IKX51_01455, partial [Bacteroidales bacterium]|nr:hypothetical protein [Bacteroidales bacterium]
MTKQKDLITNRFNSLRFCRLCHEIVKYHPEFYDDNGRYLKEEWTSFDDVGRVYGGKVVTIDDYLEIENRFIEITHAILEESGCKFVTLGYVENYRRKAVKEGKRVHVSHLDYY